MHIGKHNLVAQGHKDDERIAASLIRGKAETARTVQPGEAYQCG